MSEDEMTVVTQATRAKQTPTLALLQVAET